MPKYDFRYLNLIIGRDALFFFNFEFQINFFLQPMPANFFGVIKTKVHGEISFFFYYYEADYNGCH